MRRILLALLISTLATFSVVPARAAGDATDKGDPTKPDVGGGGGGRGGAKTAEVDLIHPNDATAFKEHEGKEVAVEGEVSKAEWSKSGKVMTIEFAEATDSKFMVAAFAKNKPAFDAAFSGDVGKALAGRKVRVTGVVKEFKGRPEIVVDKPAQIELITDAPAGADKPAEKAGGKPKA